MSQDRITSSNAAVLFVDHQTGLANGVQTQSPPDFLNNVKALVRLAQVYELPTVITTSAHDGPNGPIMPARGAGLAERCDRASSRRDQRVDNPDFARAVREDGPQEVADCRYLDGSLSRLRGIVGKGSRL